MHDHTQDGDAPGVPELSRAQELEMAQVTSSQESDSRDLVVQQAQTITALEQKVMALEREIAEIKPTYIDQPQTIATLERTNDALGQSLISQEQTRILRDQILAKFGYSLAGNQKTIATLQQTVHAQQQTIAQQRLQLHNQARHIGINNLLLARATPLNAPAFGNAPAALTPVIVTQAAAITNDTPESSQIAKRRRIDMHVGNSGTAAGLSHTCSDVSGGQVTSERLLVALGEAPYVSLGYVLDAYRYIFGSELMFSTTPSLVRIATRARVVLLEHWAPQLGGDNPVAVANLNILRRRDLEIGALRQGFLEELGLAKDSNAVVLGPRLSYVIIRMCSMSVDLLTGTILSSMFLEVTGLNLHSLNVVTRNGVQTMEPSDVCEMVKTWINKLGRLLTKHNGMEQSLAEVRECNSFYEGQCSNGDTEGLVAKRMLMSNRFQSLLFLGLQEAKVEAVIKRLIYVASKHICPRTKKCLEQLSTNSL
ncbi:hypothetical protein GGI13_005751 [Coemansia sp. RSA 455]|nr:hypothetical protein GGI13_005751 [Coemansia sp. RSA 455]